MSKISFGVRVPNSGPLASVANITRAAEEAEQMGFDSIFLHDHVVWSSEMHRHHISSGAHEALGDDQSADFYEALTTIGYLAGKTSRVQIGVACLVMPTRNPIYAAKQLATLDHLTGGRLIAGVGLGSKASKESCEFDVFGVPFSARARMTDEFVEAMRAIWTEPLASYSGRHIEFKDAEIFPKPLQKPGPAVWVGGWTDAAAKRTGRLGDGWVPGWLSPEEMARGAQIVRDTAAENGRDPEAITIAVEKLTVIDRDHDAAMARALPTVKTSSHTYERDVDQIQFALDRHIFGSVEDVRRRVGEFVDAGVTHFELKFIYPTMDELTRQMELWAEEIIPIYR
ncbi:LLM class flavin-dependent oxidoreductase [Mycobacterium sp. NAZ190054]|uniref:LLM class flavin-dependent oxidoreductase n=1 Tax=Mycobacterium sp. NAZ190054 TaxID=1747766 RepID=UPI0009EA9DE7|nr:TIGR03619 family F420-dependent LLM class oxidoreductase [Mycobacterium sp. NAZ190054]